LKKLLFSLAFLAFAFSQIQAQTYPADPFVASKEGWEVDIEKAFEISKRTGKPIMANFTGVKWCGFCVKLDKIVFKKPEFQKWAEENVVLLELDFPRRYQIPEKYRNQNASLQQAFGVRGYPTIWVFDLDQDAEGKFSIAAHGKTGFARTYDDFIGAVDQMLAKRKADAKAGK